MDGEDGRPTTPSREQLLEERPSNSSFNLKGFPSSTSATTDPWLPVPVSSKETFHLDFVGVASSSPTLDQQPNTSGFNCRTEDFQVHQWLEGVNSSTGTGGDSGFGQEAEFQGQGDQFLDTDMSPPATGNTGGGGDNNGGASSKCQKEKDEIVCPHGVISKGLSMPGLRKAVKGDITLFCSKPTCEEIHPTKWMCLQCGNIACGDDRGQGGHAKLHFKTPHSDCHSVAVQMTGNLEKAWCFDCQLELDTQSFDCVKFLRKNEKVKMALSPSSSRSLVPPIVLGPPPPPPVPKIEPPKQFSVKGKQHNNRMTASSSNSNSYNNRWDRDSGGVEWPLGLDNLGNTCFMNSALQCLSRTRSLLDKLDLHGSGNLIEILVSPEDPCVQLMNPSVDDDNDTSEFASDFERRSLLAYSGDGCGGVDSSSSQPSTSADSSEIGSGEISPSSTEIDSLLDAASSRSSRKSESEGCGDAEKQLWRKELEQELAKPLRLRLAIPRDSMTSKMRHCFKAVTRCSDASPDNEGSRNMYSRPVYSPRGIQLAVSKHFRLGHQHDSHELLRSVVDMMKKDQIRSFRLAIMQRYGVKRTEGKNCDPKLTELLKMWDRKLYHKTFVDEIFGGELVTFQECLQCGNVRRSHEEFLDLSLPIRVFRANPNPSTKKTYSLFDDDNDYVINRTVEECLRAYTEPEFLTGSNVVECEKCHRINLEKLANGALFDEVFPNIKLEPHSNSGSGKGQSKHQQKKQVKCKRQSRQAKMKAKQSHQADYEEGQENLEQSATDGLNLVEDHFRNDQSLQNTSDQKCASGDDSKSNKSGSLDDFVVVHSASTLQHHTQQEPFKQKDIENVDMDYDIPSDTDACQSTQAQENFESEEFTLSRGLSSSIKSLTLIENGMDVEEGEGCLNPEDDHHMDHHNENFDEDMDDLDEPAVDGIGNASDIDEDDESNGPACLDLGLEIKPISVAEYLAVPTAGGGGSGGTADEGFSEGENSSEEKPSQSISGRSSSHNSISEEAENIGGGGDTLACNGMGEKPAKKIPITKCPCSRRQLISRAPECLTLHLKRFQHTARGSSKLGDRVSFPYILNLTKFCSEVEEDVNRPGFKTTFDEDGEVVYSLYGIVEHSGSLHFGHYVAYVKVTGKPKSTTSSEDLEDKPQPGEDAWFYISDSHVSRTTLKQVLVQDAYILFYERIRGPEKKERLDHSLQSVEVERRDSMNTGSSSVTYTYDKPVSSVGLGPVASTSWTNNEENWEESSQQVSSTNNGDMSMTLNYESTDPVSSSTLYSSSCGPHLLGGVGTGVVLDGVSSSTDADSMDYSAPSSMVGSSTSHPLWNDEDIRGGSAFFGDIMDDGGDNETLNTSNPVSSSSDVIINPRSDGYTPLEEVD